MDSAAALVSALHGAMPKGRVKQGSNRFYFAARVYESIDLADFMRSVGAVVEMQVNVPTNLQSRVFSPLVTGSSGNCVFIAKLLPLDDGVQNLEVKVVPSNLPSLGGESLALAPKFLIADELLPDPESFHDYLAHRFASMTDDVLRATLCEMSRLMTDYFAASKD